MQNSLFDDGSSQALEAVGEKINCCSNQKDSAEFKRQVNDIIFDINDLMLDIVKKLKHGTLTHGVFSEIQKLTSALNTNINNFKLNNPSDLDTNDTSEKFIIKVK